MAVLKFWNPNTSQYEVVGTQGPAGPAAVSADANNAAILGSDDLIYVPEFSFSVTLANIPAGSVINVKEVGGSYTRPTARTDVCVIFTGVSDPNLVALDGDKWDRLDG